MNDADKIAIFWEDVYILYVAEMAQDCIFLLSFYTFESPKFARLAVVTCYGTVRSAGEAYGKLSVRTIGNQNL